MDEPPDISDPLVGAGIVDVAAAVFGHAGMLGEGGDHDGSVTAPEQSVMEGKGAVDTDTLGSAIIGGLIGAAIVFAFFRSRPPRNP
jgi:hypothetical protein